MQPELNNKTLQIPAKLYRIGELRQIRFEGAKRTASASMEGRLRELYRSYVFGNWAAVLALARSLLEVAILETYDRFGLDPTDPNDPQFTKPLKDLIREIYREISTSSNPHIDGPRLMTDMHWIRKRGNATLHQSMRQTASNVIPMPSMPLSSSVAKAAIEKTRVILEDLDSVQL